MNAKDLLGKKIIDKNAYDLAKLAEIDVNIKTFNIANIYGSIGNPLNKKYYDIPSSSILTIGDYIQVSETIDKLENKLIGNIPESEEDIVTINNLIGKTVIDSEGNIAGKVTNIDLDFSKKTIVELEITGQSLGFGQNPSQNSLSKEDIISIGDYILIDKAFVEEEEEEEDEKEDSEESEDSVKIDIE